MKIFNSNSLYQLLQFLLLTEEAERKFYIVGDMFSTSIKKNLGSKVIEVGNDAVKTQSGNLLKKILNYAVELKKLRKTYDSQLNSITQSEVFGSTIFAPLFAADNIVYALEDGTGSYVQRKRMKGLRYLLYSMLHRLFLGAEDNFDIEKKKYISKVYLTGIGTVPPDLTHKTVLIDLKDLWLNKSAEEKEIIMNIFGIQPNIFEKCKFRHTILFTQPLSEDQLLKNEAEKIAIYKKALSGIDFSNVIIKPHPRETLNYELAFPGVVQLPAEIPSQLLNLLELNISKAITLFSTAALSVGKEVEVIWYGTTLSETMKKKIGDQPISKYRVT